MAINKILYDIIENTSPRFNKSVTDGNVKDILKNSPQYLDNFFRSSIKSLTAPAGLTYEGYRICTPQETLDNVILAKNSKATYDIARSDLYLVEHIFKYKGEVIRRPQYLPFATDGNVLRISDTAYSIVPVLSDTVLSPSPTGVFVRLLLDKINIKDVQRNYIKNGDRVYGSLIYTSIVKVSTMNIDDNIGKPLTPVSLYLLGKYGIHGVFRKYIKTNKYIITTDKDVDKYKDDYNVYESTRIKPRSLKDTGYLGHTFKILIHKSVEASQFLDNFIFGLLYILDILPMHAEEASGLINSGVEEDEILFWKIMLGRITFKNSYSMDRIIESMLEHYDILEGYLDNLNQAKLALSGVKVNDFYDLLQVILENYNVWVRNSKEYNSNVDNKYIDIEYYLFYDIIVGFNKIILNINKRISKKANMSYEEVNKIFLNELTTGKIFSLIKSQQQNLAIMLCDNTLDIKYPKITALLENQSRGNGVKRGSNTQFPEHTRTLKGYDLIFGSLLFITKSAPSPTFRINTYVNINWTTGKVLYSNLVTTIVKLDNKLRGKLDADNKTIDYIDVDELDAS